MQGLCAPTHRNVHEADTLTALARHIYIAVSTAHPAYPWSHCYVCLYVADRYPLVSLSAYGARIPTET
jgi:hypothetical protein